MCIRDSSWRKQPDGDLSGFFRPRKDSDLGVLRVLCGESLSGFSPQRTQRTQRTEFFLGGSSQMEISLASSDPEKILISASSASSAVNPFPAVSYTHLRAHETPEH